MASTACCRCLLLDTSHNKTDTTKTKEETRATASMQKSSTSANENNHEPSSTHSCNSVRRVIFPCLYSTERTRENNIVVDMVPFSNSNEQSEGSPRSSPVQQQNAKNGNAGSQDTFEIQKNNNENRPTTNSATTMAATPNKRPSILRSSRFSIDRSTSPTANNNSNDTSVDASSSLDSVPSLAASLTSISTSPSMDCITSPSSPLPAMPRRSVLPPRCISEPTLRQQQQQRYHHPIQFDPNIFVREFHRTPEEHRATWFSPTELSTFKSASLAIVTSSTATSSDKKPILFSHPSLSATADEDDEEETTASAAPSIATTHPKLPSVQQQQRLPSVTRILVIDPLDVSAAVVARGVQQLFPAASIETRPRVDHNHDPGWWDVIVCAERWRPCWYRPTQQDATGSALVRAWRTNTPGTVWIGTSAHPEDETVLREAGVDLFWNLPLQIEDVNALRTTVVQRHRQKQQQGADSSGG